MNVVATPSVSVPRPWALLSVTPWVSVFRPSALLGAITLATLLGAP
jgi:hypothetical protein